MPEVESNLKDKGDCGGTRERCTLDACPLFGTIGRNGRVRGCGDPTARGKRNREKGLAKQRQARKRLGVAPSHKFGDANEERWGDALFANEVKAGVQIQPAVNAWLRIERQVISNEPDHGGQHKPTRAVLMPDGWGRDGLVMVRLSTWEELVAPALDAAYGGPA